jgi:hypothetical protein
MTPLTFFYPAPMGLPATPYMPMFAPANYWPPEPPPQLCAPYQAYLVGKHKRPGRPPHTRNCRCNQVTSHKMQWI